MRIAPKYKVCMLVVVVASLFAVEQRARAQEPSATPAPATTAPDITTAPPASTATPDAVTPPPAAPDATVQSPTAAPAQTPTAAATAAPGKPAKKINPKNMPYTGPTEIVVNPALPMLDEEGKQRLDPNDKPMFYPAVKQQRDKKGHPLFDDKGKPVFQTAKDLGYDEKGKKISVVKEKPVKTIPVSITRGTFTVDGVIGKAALNYQIPDLKYLYMYVPGIGIAVVSNHPFPAAKEEKAAFTDKNLTVTIGEHIFQLTSDNALLGKKAKPESAYVLLDRSFSLPSRYPEVGYGQTLKAPYAWPGSKANATLAGVITPPPIPKNLMPVQLLKPCPAGMMRRPGPVSLPGQVAPDQPCISIAKGTASQAAAPAKPVVPSAPQDATPQQ
jgi:hypothetical protein